MFDRRCRDRVASPHQNYEAPARPVQVCARVRICVFEGGINGASVYITYQTMLSLAGNTCLYANVVEGMVTIGEERGGKREMEMERERAK